MATNLDNLGPLPKIDPRDTRFRKAESEIGEAIDEVARRHGLPLVEVVWALSRIQSWHLNKIAIEDRKRNRKRGR